MSKIKLLTEYINLEKKFAENFQKLVEIQNSFAEDLVSVGTLMRVNQCPLSSKLQIFSPQLLAKSPKRELLKEGDYMVKKKGVPSATPKRAYHLSINQPKKALGKDGTSFTSSCSMIS